MNIEQLVAARIAEVVRANDGPILGSQLGTKVKPQFPEFSWKPYGNLKSFVNRFCSDTVSFHGKQGFDDLWVSKPPTHSHCPGGAISLPSEPLPDTLPHERLTGISSSTGTSKASSIVCSPWKAFVEPGISNRVTVSLENGEVRCLTADEPVPANFVEIPRMTISETRQIAEEFIPQLDPSSHSHLRSILATDDFWHKWANEMKAEKHSTHSKLWLHFRYARIRDLFKERVKAAGARQNIVEASAECLARMKANRRQNNTVEKPSVSSPMPPMLREVAIGAIGMMSDEDLRRLWLPLGVVFNALRKG